jgi:16S rRNA (cytosine967-C5)-methyltransferase
VSAGPETANRVSPARRVAYDVVRRTFEDGDHTDRALRAEAARAGLEGRELAFAMRLAYETVQRRRTLDAVIAELAGRDVERLDPPVLAALRLGLLQLAFLDGVADHAAVDQAVELAKAAGRGHGLVNAVLRRAAGEARSRIVAMPDDTAEAAALRHSHPDWVARLWWGALGADDARALMAANNEPAETAVRVNTLVADPAAVAERTGGRRVDGLGEGLVLDRVPDLGAELMPQSRASMAVARVLAPQPGERVLDLCAAPGAKATHLAALMEDRGEIVAVERDPARAEELRATCARLRAGCVDVRVADAREPVAREAFDRVLVDPPCSGLGTLQARPDLRWRVRAADVEGLASRQAAILDVAAAALRPGGTLVYSTCTLSPTENEDQVAALVERHPHLAVDDLHADLPLWEHPHVPRFRQTMPHRHGTAGFFIARLRREGTGSP